MTNPFGIHDAWLPYLQVTLAPAPDLAIRPIEGRFCLAPDETGDTRSQVTVTNTVTGGQANLLLRTVEIEYAENDTLAEYLDEAQWFHPDLLQAIQTLVQEPHVLDIQETLLALKERVAAEQQAYLDLWQVGRG